MISVFEAFNWSLLDAIQPATSSMQAYMLVLNAVVLNAFVLKR